MHVNFLTKIPVYKILAIINMNRFRLFFQNMSHKSMFTQCEGVCMCVQVRT